MQEILQFLMCYYPQVAFRLGAPHRTTVGSIKMGGAVHNSLRAKSDMRRISHVRLNMNEVSVRSMEAVAQTSQPTVSAVFFISL